MCDLSHSHVCDMTFYIKLICYSYAIHMKPICDAHIIRVWVIYYHRHCVIHMWLVSFACVWHDSLYETYLLKHICYSYVIHMWFIYYHRHCVIHVWLISFARVWHDSLSAIWYPYVNRMFFTWFHTHCVIHMWIVAFACVWHDPISTVMQRIANWSFATQLICMRLDSFPYDKTHFLTVLQRFASWFRTVLKCFWSRYGECKCVVCVCVCVCVCARVW